MTSAFSVYCIADVSAPPVSLHKRGSSSSVYSCHLAVPIPDQLVIFSEGDWEHEDGFDVMLSYKDDHLQLGQVTKSNRCLFWKKATTVMPESMVSESEKGLAKLMLEKSEGPPVLVSMVTNSQTSKSEIQDLNENTPQMDDEPVTAPARPQKKRSSSLGKPGVSSDGPAAKKQKKDKAVTRVRTPKSESKGTDSSDLVAGSPDNALKESNKNRRKSDNKGQEGVKATGTGKSPGVKTSSENVQKENKSRKRSDTKSGGAETKSGKDVNSPVALKKNENNTDKMLGKESKSSPVVKETKGDTKKVKELKVDAKKVKELKSETKKVKETKNDTKTVDNNRKKSNKSETKAEVGPDVKHKNASKDSKSKQDPVSKQSKKNVSDTKQINLLKNATEKNKQDSALKEEKQNKRSSLNLKQDKTLKETKDNESKEQSTPKGDKQTATALKRQSSVEMKGKRGKKDGKIAVSGGDVDSGKPDKENISANIPVGREVIQKLLPEMLAKMQKTEETISKKGKVATCKDLTTRSLRPSARWGHSLCFIHKNLSVLIGGQGNKQQLNKDSLWTLDTETRRWDEPEFTSESQKPEYRMGHTATYDPMVRCIYVYGGSKNTRWFHDVHVLDTEEWKWQLVKVSGKAPTRAYHSATLYRHELWVFGGVYPRPDPQPDGCSNDIHIFSPVMESWYNPIVKGEKPLPRSGHSANLLDDRLVIFGGWDAPISYSDLHILDMGIVEWTQPDITGTPPSPRSWHASCALSKNRLLIHGGYNGDLALEDTHIFNLDQLNWTQIKVDNSPSARVGHRAVCMPYRHDNEEEDEVIIFGGGDNDGAYFDDLFSMYVPFEPEVVS